MPKIVLSDMGIKFCNRILDGIFLIMGIKHIHTTPYFPPSNAQVKRHRQTAKRTISKSVAWNHNDWTAVLPFATSAYNSAVRNTIKLSPFFTLFMREPTMPIDLVMPTFRLAPLVQEIKQQIEDFRTPIQARSEVQQDYSVSYHNEQLCQVNF